jgi:hypothetical protein
MAKMSLRRGRGLIFSKIIPWGGAGRGRTADADDALGRGLWRRAYDDCAGAAAGDPDLAELLPAVRSLAEQAQRTWPSDSLDVPADPAGRAAHDRLRALRRAIKEAAYRSRLLALGQGGEHQQRLREDAVRAARALTVG